MIDFAAMDAVYAEYFTKDCPARACFEVARLLKEKSKLLLFCNRTGNEGADTSLPFSALVRQQQAETL